MFISAATRVLAIAAVVFTLLSEGTHKNSFPPIMIDRIRRSSDNAGGGESCRQIFDRIFHAMHRSATLLIHHPVIFLSLSQNGYTETKLRIPASISRVT